MTEAQANIEYAAQDASSAKWEFYDYCEGGPGAHAATIIKAMGGERHTKAFWDAALGRAMQARAEWLAA